MRTNRTRRILAVAGVAALAMTMGAVPSTAEIVGDFRAGADADLIEVSGVAVPPGCGDEGVPILGELIPCDFELAQLVLGDTETAVDSNNGLSYTGDDGLSAYGHGSNIDPDLLNAGSLEGAISAELIQEATAKAPIGPTSHDPDPIEIPADPLLHVNLSTVSADALDVGAGNNTCPVQGEDRLNLSNGNSELVGLAVLPDALGEGMDLLGVEDPEGVSFAQSSVDAVDSLVPGPNWGIESTARVRLAPVSLLGGALDIQLSDPVLTVSNDGTGPDVSYTPSIVTINGDTVVDGETIEFLDVGEVLPSPLSVTVHIANQEDVVIDGTTVTVADAVLLSVVLADTLEVATIAVGNLSAAAEVPEGGISFQNCDDDNPLEVHKTLSASDVTPGESFDYTITVANRDDSCTLTDIVVTDVVTGPDGTTVEATPEPTSVDGLTLTWDNIADLAPNESVTIQISVTAPADASAGDRFTDTVDVTANCDGAPFEDDDFVDGPVVFDGDAPDGCFLGDSNKTATHIEVTPGAVFSYLVNVFNTGSDPCTDITVVDTLPDGFGFVSCSPACTEDGGEVTFEIDELAPGASQTLSITVTAPDETGHFDNVATIDAGNNPGDPVVVTTDCPLVDDEIIPKPPEPADRGRSGMLPKTGGGAALIGLGLLGGLATLRRRTA